MAGTQSEEGSPLDSDQKHPPAPPPHGAGAGDLRTVVLAAVGVLSLSAALIVGGNLWIVWQGGRHQVTGSAAAPQAQVAIVLGAKVLTDGSPSPMLQDRLLTAIELYRLGKVKKLLLSGDHGTTAYDEVNAMRVFVLEHGVLPEDVFMDHAGFSTYDTMYRARDVFLVNDALVVTQGFHLARAVYTARTLGLEATGVPADLRDYQNEGRFAARDWLARTKALVQLHVLHSAPRFLGPTMPIGADGRVTAG